MVSFDQYAIQILQQLWVVGIFAMVQLEANSSLPFLSIRIVQVVIEVFRDTENVIGSKLVFHSRTNIDILDM